MAKERSGYIDRDDIQLCRMVRQRQREKQREEEKKRQRETELRVQQRDRWINKERN